MNAEFQYDVFLSHNSVDKPRVGRLAERLRAVGFNFAPRPSDFALSNAVLFRDPANAGRRFSPLLRADRKLRDAPRRLPRSEKRRDIFRFPS